MSGGHLPVMLNEVIEALAPRDGASYVDGTFGGGGYTTAILEAADCKVLGIDRDPAAIARGQALVSPWLPTLVGAVGSDFDDYREWLTAAGVTDAKIVGQRPAGMVHLQDRAVHVMAVLLYPAAYLAHVVVRQADGLLPEGELCLARVGKQADIEMGFGEIHGDNRECLLQNIQTATRLRHTMIDT